MFQPVSNIGKFDYDRCFMQNLSCRDQNEVILVELES
jgi:hypothetical protein